MKRLYPLFLKGMGMGAADAVPGVSGGTIAIVTGIYEELIDTIRRFGPGAFAVWRREGLGGLVRFLNLRFLLPLLLGIGVSLVSVAHLVTWLMVEHPLLLDAFFFGLVVASAVIVARRMGEWRMIHGLPLVIGLFIAQSLPGLLPSGGGAGMLFIGGAVAISAMLLPGLSGTFLLLLMGLYGTVMGAVKSFDLDVLSIFALGCLVGLFTSSRLLSWLFRHHYGPTLAGSVGLLLGSLPILWPWRQMTSYTLDARGESVPLAYDYLTPWDYAQLFGVSAQLPTALALMAAGFALVLVIDKRGSKGRLMNVEDGRKHG
ncbi:DUF368 domain-containing protein [Halotalea alkalilenta]|uniref:DUF368 domain-containing protein n=1 Tax=Halotalea alkalilenta TaxID=376489 RepID=UPI00048170BF|nr:DUF368 domain-containing protein [Halotalea alkalilenta]